MSTAIRVSTQSIVTGHLHKTLVRADNAVLKTLSLSSDLSLIPLSAGEIRAMGRSFQSIRQGVKSIAERWARSSRAPRERERKCGERLVECAKQHSSEGFVGCDDPLEAVIFSVLVEMLKDLEKVEMEEENHVDL